MNTSNDRAAIELEAAKWLRKREGGDWDAADEARLQEWLEADTNNRVAYLRLEAAWKEMNRLRALGAGFPRGTIPTPDQLEGAKGDWASRQVRSKSRRPILKFASLAASLVLGIALVAYVGTDYFTGTRYSAEIGAITTVPLKDGTNVVLSTGSRIRVQLKERERHIDLTKGEAFFEVAPDPTRPFVVQAGDKRIIAVGTKFSVRRDGGDVRVVVTEGKVRLEGGQSAEASTPGYLTAGTVATATSAGVQVKQLSPAEAEEQLSWRQGFVAFHETALAEAVAEFNRYNDRKIVIEDSKLAAIEISGKFRATNIDTLVNLLERTYGIHVTRGSDRIILDGTE